MNTSKILKKSLAMVLAVMMIVAMIPLSASAAATTKLDGPSGVIFTIETKAGEIAADGETGWKITAPYDQAAGTPVDVEIVPDNSDYTKVVHQASKATTPTSVNFVSDKATVPVTLAGNTKNVETTETVTIYLANADESKKSPEYTLTVTSPVASGSAELAEASITYWNGASAGPLKGTVDGTTAKFVLPWGAVIPTGTNGTSASATEAVVALTLANPTATNPYPIPTAASVFTDGKGTFAIPVQTGETKNVNVEISLTPGITDLKIGDGEVKADTSNPPKYTVTFPAGTDLSTLEPAVSYTLTTEAAKAVAQTGGSVRWGLKADKGTFSATNDAKNDGKTVVTAAAAAGAPYILSLNDGTNSLDYEVAVVVTPNSEAEIESITAKTSDNFEVTGKVDGQNINVELPKGTTGTVTYTVKMSTGAQLSVPSGSKVTVTSATTATFTTDASTNPTISNEQLIVTAEDGTTKKNYRLNSAVSETANNDPAVESLTFTIPGATSDKDVKIEGEISGLTITLKGIPYSTATSVIQTVGNYKLSLPNGVKEDSANLAAGVGNATYKDGFKFGIISDGGQKKTYTVKFEKDAASTDKALNTVEFTQAATEEKKTDDNTYKGTVKGTAISIELPYSIYDDATTTALNPVIEISDKAAFILADEDTAISGYGPKKYISSDSSIAFDEKGDAEYKGTDIYGADVAAYVADSNDVKLVVLDEFAVFAISEDKGATYKKLADIIEDKDLVGHFTVYTFNVTQAAAKTGSKLIDLIDETGEAKTTVTGQTFKIEMPASYAAGATYTVDVDEMAKIIFTAGSKVPVADGETVSLGAKKVSDEWVLTVDVSGTQTPVTEVEVEAENGNTTTYNTFSVEVADAVSGAEITKLLVNDIEATISGKAIEAHVLKDADLTKLVVTGEKSKLADIKANTSTPMSADNKATVAADAFKFEFDPTKDNITLTNNTFTLTVEAEDSSETNVYTVTVKADAEEEPKIENPYPDVNEGDWFYDDALKANELGLITGNAGKFDALGKTTRAQFAVIIARLDGADEEALKASTTTSSFEDIPDGHWSSWAVEYVAEKGYMSGQAGKFNWKKEVTRDMAATVIARVLGITEQSEEKFTDDDQIKSWYREGIYACRKAGIVDGQPDGSFGPTDPINRGAMAKIVVKAAEIKGAK